MENTRGQSEMKRQTNTSQYRQLRQSTAMSPDVADELKVLRSLENRDAKKA